MSDALAGRLAAAGFVSAEEEAEELRWAAAGDDSRLEELALRRLTGEPLAWITGRTRFCGLELAVDPGVYVPRPHTELIAEAAAARLPPNGVAVDVCTGSGAIAAVLAARRPQARVVGLDIDAGAVACARRNGVEAFGGDLLSDLPAELARHVDVLTAVTPYVPTCELELLQRDTFAFEDAAAYAGGAGGIDIVRRLLPAALAALRPGGILVLELGQGQPEALGPDLAPGFSRVETLHDEDGDERGLVAVANVRL